MRARVRGTVVVKWGIGVMKLVVEGARLLRIFFSRLRYDRLGLEVRHEISLTETVDQRAKTIIKVTVSLIRHLLCSGRVRLPRTGKLAPYICTQID